MTDAKPEEVRTTVAVVRLTRGRELRASLVTYGEEQRIALRVFYQQPPDSTTWIGGSGFSLRSESLDALERAVKALRRAVDATPDEPNATPAEGG